MLSLLVYMQEAPNPSKLELEDDSKLASLTLRAAWDDPHARLARIPSGPGVLAVDDRERVAARINALLSGPRLVVRIRNALADARGRAMLAPIPAYTLSPRDMRIIHAHATASATRPERPGGYRRRSPCRVAQPSMSPIKIAQTRLLHQARTKFVSLVHPSKDKIPAVPCAFKFIHPRPLFTPLSFCSPPSRYFAPSPHGLAEDWSISPDNASFVFTSSPSVLPVDPHTYQRIHIMSKAK
ncbi:hypothetical protein B0H19DRAFT_1374854 [Mycena capillaripes]|nr:hypothetical protein B0H19DRAFT_1374854 [Mycena capillaripes]